jgi:hypothetical protein
MSRVRPSRNNRRKTRGLFTTNPKQYLQLQNLKKYEHTYDTKLDYVIVINKQTREPKGIFGYEELLAFLGENNHHECLYRVLKLWSGSNPDDFKITEMSENGFHLKAHIYEEDEEGIDFTFVKNGSDLYIFKGQEREINGGVLTLYPKGGFTHIDYNGTKIYFDRYVIAGESDEDFESVLGILSCYHQ